MSEKVSQQTKEEEAARLSALMAERWEGSDASFAAAAGRQRAELNQHLKATRPIPLTAAKAYAAVLRCGIGEFSKRWADHLIVGEDHHKPEVSATDNARVLEIIKAVQKNADNTTFLDLIDSAIKAVIGEAHKSTQKREKRHTPSLTGLITVPKLPDKKQESS